MKKSVTFILLLAAICTINISYAANPKVTEPPLAVDQTPNIRSIINPTNPTGLADLTNPTISADHIIKRDPLHPSGLIIGKSRPIALRLCSIILPISMPVAYITGRNEPVMSWYVQKSAWLFPSFPPTVYTKSKRKGKHCMYLTIFSTNRFPTPKE